MPLIEIKEEIENLVLNYKQNERKIDIRRSQYADLLKDKYNALDRLELSELVMRDLTEYILYISSFNSGMPFMIFDAQSQMIKALETIGKQQQEKQNLAVSIAPSTGKSSIIQFFTSWAFLRNPDIAVLYLTNKETRAKQQSALTRDIIVSDSWVSLNAGKVEIDNTKLSGAESGKLKWKLKSGDRQSGFEAGAKGNILGASAGNPNTLGFKGMLVADDLAAQTAMTQSWEREVDIETYKGAIKSRRRTPTIPIIINMQRLHKNDLIGYVEANESDDYHFVKIPALIKKNGVYCSADPRAISVESLLEMRDKNPSHFWSMYQQSPRAEDGQKFKEEWITYYETPPSFDNFLLVFTTTDFAFKKGEDSDRSVFCTWGLDTNGYLFLLDLTMGRWNIQEAKGEFLKFWQLSTSRWHSRFATIENVVSNLLLKEELIKSDPTIAFEEMKRGAANNKVARASDSVPYLASKRVLFPKNNKDIQSFVNEILDFSDDLSHEHDDCVDAMTDACYIAFGQRNVNSIFI